jgi:glycosyltransferase involved in cell wall biosynthesis
MPKKAHPRLSIVIPAYNEGDVIGPVLDEIIALKLDAEILVVSDGSTDNTAEVALSRKGVRVLEHPYNIGNGAAVKSGIRASRGDFILLMDGDGQHPPKDIPRLIAALDRYDMVVGARSSASTAAPHRTLANRLYNWFASYIVDHKVEDLTSGFRAVRASLARGYVYMLPNGFSYPTTLTIAMFRSGHSVKYEPIASPARKGQSSKIRLARDGVGFLLTITRIGTLFAPMKVFLPVTLLLAIPGIAYMTYSLGVLHRFSSFSGLLILAGIFLFMMGLISEQIALVRMSQADHTFDEVGQ